MNKKRRWGDRKEGRRVRTLPPMSYVVPYIMPTRNDAQNMFSDSVNITETDKFLRELRKKGYKSMSILHVILAAYVRTIATRPGLNRFCSGQKIYHRDTIEINMTVKREMSLEAPDTVVKVHFEPTDTLIDVYEKFDKVVKEAVAEEGNPAFEKVVSTLVKLPGFIFRIAVWFLNFLDYHGWLPQALLDISPFHGSMIITSMGSLGIPPIYHHLYNFGNLPLFIAYGKKYHVNNLNEDGTVEKQSMMDLKVVTDERICDGFYYASCFKIIKKLLASPESLMTPPEKVIEDID